MEPEIFVEGNADLGEGPIWDNIKGALYWIDILGHRIHINDQQGDKSFKIDGEVSSLSPSKRGDIIATVNLSFYRIDMEKGHYSKMLTLNDEPTTNRFNDGKCDILGRYWAGTMDRGERSPVASLYVLDSGSIRRELHGLTISNGLGWSPDNKFMFLIDTPTRKVWKFSFDLERGHISDRNVAADFNDLPGVPDGMTVDSEGFIWVAHWGGWMVSRWDPYTGKLLEKVRLPVKNVSSLTFGGNNLKTIFITTAKHGLSQEEIANQPLAGSVFKLDTDVRGLPVNLCQQ
jgi:sugar lactone lactonase YvrE